MNINFGARGCVNDGSDDRKGRAKTITIVCLILLLVVVGFKDVTKPSLEQRCLAVQEK